MAIQEHRIQVKGMTCVHCEQAIKTALEKIPNLKVIDVSYKQMQVKVAYDSALVSQNLIEATILAAGYEVPTSGQIENLPKLSHLIWVLLAFWLFTLLNRHGVFNRFPTVSSEMSLGLLFVVGVLTSVHCIAMCGGINLSQCLPKATGIESVPPSQWTILRPSLLYNAGRVVSYTIVGGIVGALGSELSFGENGRAILTLLAGAVMVLMGLNMLGYVPFMRGIQQWLNKHIKVKSPIQTPFAVGLANGLLPCGPLQAMQIYALGTGSALMGALSMFIFSLGTVPLMLGLGVFASRIGKDASKRMLKAGGLLVVILGVVMFQRGFALTGSSGLISGLNSLPSGFSFDSGQSQSAAVTSVVTNGEQIVTAEVTAGGYPQIVLKKGIPAKINFHAAEGSLNGCNSAIIIQAFGVQKELSVGDNWVSFTPEESGTVGYSCWMGMIQSQIDIQE